MDSSKMWNLITSIGLAFLVVVLIYGVWEVTRVWNYQLSYESLVQETVCRMVKAEQLKHPCTL